MDIENDEVYKIVTPGCNVFYYPLKQEMFFEFYDEKEDEFYEVLVWDKDGFTQAETPFDKIKYLTIFKEYGETK